MDWLICIGGGLFLGLLCAAPSFFRALDATLDEMESRGVHKRRK
jgi:hypothetical protein